MSVDEPYKIEWVHCNRCLRKTQHDVLVIRTHDESADVNSTEFTYVSDYKIIHTVLECRGCGSVTLRRYVYCEDTCDGTEDFYPPQVSRQAPRWRFDLPPDFRELMNEIYTALHSNSRRLALMGARALIDLFMNETIGDVGGFELKLKQLVDDGHLSEANKKLLGPVLDAGHAAIHRAYNPTRDDIILVIDIVELLLLPLAKKDDVDALKTNTPTRTTKKP
jgi:hypothetical protein